MIPEYKNTLDDEIDWKIIDQLPPAASRFPSHGIQTNKNN